MLFNNFDTYWFLLGTPPHITAATVWTWRIGAAAAIVAALTGLIWSLAARRTGFVIAHGILLSAVIVVAVVSAVPSDPFRMSPGDYSYCHTDGRHDCP